MLEPGRGGTENLRRSSASRLERASRVSVSEVTVVVENEEGEKMLDNKEARAGTRQAAAAKGKGLVAAINCVRSDQCADTGAEGFPWNGWKKGWLGIRTTRAPKVDPFAQRRAGMMCLRQKWRGFSLSKLSELLP